MNPTLKKACPCGEMFYVLRETQKFCSKPCAGKYRPKATERVDQFLELLNKHRNLRVIASIIGCSRQYVDQVIRKYHLERYKEIQKEIKEEIKKKHTHKCPQCKNDFFSDQNPKFCSRECLFKARPGISHLPILEQRRIRRERRREYYKTPRGQEVIKRVVEKQRSKKGYAERTRAHGFIAYEIKMGRIIRPDKCSSCPNTTKEVSKIEAHIESTEKPYKIRWLCSPCRCLMRKRG